nr:immunoglobulin heavy chain junction region [Mus musculus]
CARLGITRPFDYW